MNLPGVRTSSPEAVAHDPLVPNIQQVILLTYDRSIEPVMGSHDVRKLNSYAVALSLKVQIGTADVWAALLLHCWYCWLLGP